MPRFLSEFTRAGNKTGGVQSGGQHGGVYKDNNGNAYLIKREEQNTHNIAEFLGSKVFGVTAPGYGAEVQLVRVAEGTKLDETGTGTYLASKLFADYKDLYVDIYESMGQPVPRDRPKFVGDMLTSGLAKEGYAGFSETMVTSLLIGDRDTHWGNLGAVKAGNAKHLRRIDFGWAFSDLAKPLDPERVYLPGMGPRNHFREYPAHLKFNPEFTSELRRVAGIDLTKCLEESVRELEQCYGKRPLKEFAAYIGIKEGELKSSAVGDPIISKLQTVFKERQKELIKIACEIDLGLCVDKKSHKPDKDKLKDFVSKNTQFCKELVEGKKDYLARIEKSFFREVLEWIGIYQDLHKVIAQELKTLIAGELALAGHKVNVGKASSKLLSDRKDVSRGRGISC